MASPTISVYSDGSIQFGVPELVLWEVNALIGVEDRNYGPRDGAPCVFRAGEVDKNSYYTTFRMTQEVQLFQADLLALSKYGLHYVDLLPAQKDYIGKKFSALYGNTKAFCNNTGFGKPCRNYVTGENLTADWPKFHPLICGTNLISGSVVVNKWNEQVLKIDAFHEVPSDYDISILEDPRVLYATNIYKDGHISNFPQLDGARVPYPFFVNLGMGHYPIKWLKRH